MNNKSLPSAFLAATLISILILVVVRFGTVQASTGDNGIPKPSVPDFTLKYVDKTIEATINNNLGASYYNFRYKGHYAEEWSYYPFNPDSRFGYSLPDAFYVPYKASNSSYTVAALPSHFFKDVPEGGQVDVQVQALFGDFDADPWGHLLPIEPTYDFDFTGTISDWSETQTITFGEGQTPTPSPTSTPTPTPAPTPIPVPGQNSFSVESNSTVTNLFFNSTSSELSFTVNGTSGTGGYVKVTIAKSLVSSVQNIKVYLDGAELDVAITEDEDSWLLSFNYMHSTHHVRISLAANAAATTFLGSEFWIGVVVIVVVVGVFLLFYFKKRNR